ncbi:MAG TPA: hypothetical protein VGO46_14035, partial [Gemmatimonadaceae bacterium]|nr:hypothetical protein [Gemmatimonadaceae bacterium]
ATPSPGGDMTKDSKKHSKSSTATHAGAEAAEGMRSGSQPLEERTTEHESGYGGKGGEPRVSSDQRESTDDDGSLRSESNKR